MGPQYGRAGIMQEYAGPFGDQSQMRAQDFSKEVDGRNMAKAQAEDVQEMNRGSRNQGEGLNEEVK